MEYKVVMPYLGGILSDNGYKTRNRATKPYVRRWMKDLAEKVRSLNIPESKEYTIKLSGFFTDERHPDIHNLHKVIGDSIKEGLSVDDKYFFFYDKEVKLGYFDPYLEIVIVPAELLEVGAKLIKV